MKKRALLLSLMAATALFGACGKKTEETPKPTPTPNETVDTVTNPSLVTDSKTLDVAAEKSWIVILKNDVKTDKDIVLKGGLKKGEDVVGRKLALYDQDADRNKTASYTLTAPKLTIKDKDANIKGGTVVGDVYVEGENFSLTDAKIEGNVYFKDEACKNTFTMDETSSVTGVQEVK